VALVDYFLKMDGIPGESADAKHKGEIDLEAFGWGETNTPSGAPGGGGGAGKVQMQDFNFTTRVNKASPLLFLACAMGKHIKEATLTVRKAGKAQQEYLIVKFSDLLITSYQVAGVEAGDVGPTDSISFNFSKVEYQYRPEKADGSLNTAVKAGWDVKQNKKL
jgi:type VI secretion system secreted protein Hcp